jgi:hypothetical protein
MAEPQPPKREQAHPVAIVPYTNYTSVSGSECTATLPLVRTRCRQLSCFVRSSTSIGPISLGPCTQHDHDLLRRARVLGGQLDGPDGTKVRIEHQEFPWDVGIWSNFRQAMGTWNLLAWGWPFAGSPSVESGLVYEHNEIDGR